MLALCARPLSLSGIRQFIHVVRLSVTCSFPLLSGIPFMGVPRLIHALVERRLLYLQFGAVTKTAIINMHIEVLC